MYSKIDGLQIYYQRIGRGNNLVMLHGWKQDVASFWPVVKALKDKYTVWLVDLPGFGRSDLPRKDFTISDYAEVIQKFIKQNKIGKPSILGHSLGGRIAIKLASQNSKSLDKVILEDSAGIGSKRDLLKVIFYFAARVSNILVPDFLNLKSKLRHNFYKNLGSDYLDAGPLRDILRNILAEDLTPVLPKIKNEVLLIWGEKDPIQETSLKNGKKMYHLIPKSRIEVFEDVGHFPHLESPERFVHYVKDFI